MVSGGEMEIMWREAASVKSEVVPFHVAEAYRGNRGMAPLILNLGNLWR